MNGTAAGGEVGDVVGRRERADDRLSVPWWLPAVTLLLAVAGIAVAAYLTDAHYNEHLVLACPDRGTINCAKVTTSPESKILGIPVALLGLLFYVSVPVLLIPAAWRSPSRLVRGGRLLASAVGVVFILWLVYAELFRIDAICLYCTAVHVITVLLFATIAVGTALTAPTRDADPDDLDDLEPHDRDDAEDLPAAGAKAVRSGGALRA